MVQSLGEGTILRKSSLAICLSVGIFLPRSFDIRSSTSSATSIPAEDRKVDMRLHGKGNSKLPWRKAGQPRHLVDVVDSEQ